MNPPVVELEGVGLSLQGQTILQDIHLRVEPGDFLGILGPNGGGKSMLIKIMLGLVAPDRGSVRLFGRPPQQTRGRVGYVPQFAGFDRQYPISVLDTVLMGRLGRRGAFRSLGAEDKDLARRCLDRLGLTDLADRQIGRLSLGQLQRVLVARALAVEPEMLVLDEPTASLDPGGGADVYRILEELSEEMTILLVSHDLGVVSTMVSSIACVNQKLYYHPESTISREVFDEAYGCPLGFVTHQHTHFILDDHKDD
jgi:zinc transport system ATP-binding protein